MFKKVLLSEDLDTIGKGIMTLMEDLKIKDVFHTQYCDEAYLKIRKSAQDGNLYDLLITDLSFIPDFRPQKIDSGEALIEKVRKKYPDVKIIVYTVEDRPERVRHLTNKLKVDAYVNKGRKGLWDLKDAIQAVSQGKKYISPDLDRKIKAKPPVELIESDIELLKMISLGHSQSQISEHFKKINMSPSSLSAIEKRLGQLRHHFGAADAIHLISITKDLGII